MFAFVGCPQVRHRQECNKKPKRALLNWLGGLGGTPQVLSSTPRGSEFQAGVKKNPLVCPTANAQVKKAWPSSHKAMVPVSGWGRGSGVFLGLCEKVFSITAMPGGRSYPLQVEFFFKHQSPVER